MRKSALAIVILAMSPIAHAGGADDFSLLRCGVNFGGKTLTYNENTSTKTKRDARMNHVLGAAQTEPVQYQPAITAESSSAPTLKVETRLPPKFTLATVGCSWR